MKDSEDHQKRADYARETLKKQSESCATNSKLFGFTFDLEKTQLIPYMNNSVVFYKRQMCLYNLWINTRHDNRGHMFISQETEGKGAVTK